MRPDKRKRKVAVTELIPVQVFCRVKPYHGPEESRCIEIIDETKIRVHPPADKVFSNSQRCETLATYTRVFPQGDCQITVFEELGYGLVEKLIQGKNGLLFAYGVTGSGKTHTLTGSIQKPGIIPRTLSCLFQSLSELLLQKNGVYIDGETNVVFDEIVTTDSSVPDISFPGLSKSEENWEANCYLQSVPEADSSFGYIVYISFIEMYNGRVYDLLSGSGNPKSRQNLKIVRELSAAKIFSETERQFTNVNDAYRAFLSGKKRRHQEKTGLNDTSSRGHAVFTIRLAKIPLNASFVTENSELTVVSQLSICDLAGSERARRTNNEGDRLKEAGNINVSLSTLQKCIMTLHENQKITMNIIPGVVKIVPYRDNPITNLFKSYFEGNGHIKMIVCISPKGEEYEENLHVVKFSEMTQEITVKFTTPKANKVKVNYRNGGSQKIASDTRKYSIEFPPCPPYLLTKPDDENTLLKYKGYMENFLATIVPVKKKLSETLNALKIELRGEFNNLTKFEKIRMQDKSQIDELTSKLTASKMHCDAYKRKVGTLEEELHSLRDEIERIKGEFALCNQENKHLKEQSTRLEAELCEKYDQLYKKKVEKYALNMAENIKKINQIRDITFGNPEQYQK